MADKSTTKAAEATEKPAKPSFDLNKVMGVLGDQVTKLASEGSARLGSLETMHVTSAKKAFEADDLDAALAHILQAKFYRDLIVASKKV